MLTSLRRGRRLNLKIPVTLEMLDRNVSTRHKDNPQPIGIAGAALMGFSFYFARSNSKGCDGWTRRYPLTRMGMLVL